MWKKISIAGARTRSVVKNSGRLRANGCGTCVSHLGKMLQGEELRELEWAPPKDATLLLPTPEPTPEEYGPWQLAGEVGRARSQIAGEAFVCKRTGSCAVPPGLASTSGEVRQENAFTRACRLPGLPDRLSALCEAQSNAWQKTAKGNRARRVSVVRRLLPQPSTLPRQPILLGPMRWVDAGRVGQGARFVAGGQPDFQRQYVEVLPLPQTLPETKKPPPRPPRAVRSRQSFRWQAQLNRKT